MRVSVSLSLERLLGVLKALYFSVIYVISYVFNAGSRAYVCTLYTDLRRDGFRNVDMFARYRNCNR